MQLLNILMQAAAYFVDRPSSLKLWLRNKPSVAYFVNRSLGV